MPSTSSAPVRRVVVMGVAGSGKSTVGSALADRLALAFLDGDSLHPATNIAKMAAGIALDDADRAPWLDAVGQTLAAAPPPGIVVACSALKRDYRNRLHTHASDTVFVYLEGTRELLTARLRERSGHFMSIDMLASQLQALEPLEPDERGFSMDIDQDPDAIVTAAADRLIRTAD